MGLSGYQNIGLNADFRSRGRHICSKYEGGNQWCVVALIFQPSEVFILDWRVLTHCDKNKN